jgi:hypothetical protein
LIDMARRTTGDGPLPGDTALDERPGTRVALIEYFVTSSASLVFLVTPSAPAPSVWQLSWADGRQLTWEDLQRIAARLLIDFQGIRAVSVPAELLESVFGLEPSTNRGRRMYTQPHRHLPGGDRKTLELTYFERLGPVLFPEELLRALSGVELLCIVPHGPLHALPFAALILTDGKRLIEHFGVCTAPSAASVLACQRNNRRRLDAFHAPRSLLSVAVACEEDYDHALERDASIFSALDLGPEKSLVSRSGPREASKEAFIADHGYDVIHVSCHGVAFDDRTHALHSGLLLSDGDRRPSSAAIGSLRGARGFGGYLSAREMFGLSLNTDLITLRACSSGRSHVALGDELLGIVRALLTVGAPSLIVSKWNVDVESSERLMREFYRRWLGRPMLPKWKALRDAQLAMLHEDRGSLHSHPYCWAALELVGDWL